jgi:hypothetical protein
MRVTFPSYSAPVSSCIQGPMFEKIWGIDRTLNQPIRWTSVCRTVILWNSSLWGTSWKYLVWKIQENEMIAYDCSACYLLYSSTICRLHPHGGDEVHSHPALSSRGGGPNMCGKNYQVIFSILFWLFGELLGLAFNLTPCHCVKKEVMHSVPNKQKKY